MSRRKPGGGRRARELDLALAGTLLFAVMAMFFLAGGGMQGRSSPLYPAVSALLMVAAWWWAIRSIRARTAAGKTLAELQALTPSQFEEWVAARFRDQGYDVRLTGSQGDHGVDLLAEKGGETAVVQCKNYRVWSVGEPVLRDLYGTLHDFGASEAFIVTTGRLTRAASDWIGTKPIVVWDGEYLARLAKSSTTAQEALPTVSAADARMPDAEANGKPTCPRCSSELVQRRNRQTGEPFLACPKYPDCRYTRPLAPSH